MEWLLLRAKSQSDSYWQDALTLAQDIPGWFFCWTWNGAYFAFLKYSESTFWAELLVAVALTSLIALWQSLACYRSAAAAVAMGGSWDTLAARYKAMPPAFTFTLAIAWWMLLRLPVSIWLTKDNSRSIVIMIMYWFLIHKTFTHLIHRFTTQGSHATMAKEEVNLDRARSLKDLVDSMQSVGHHLETLMVGLAGFILGNGWFETVNKLFFEVICDCKSAALCSFPSNLLMTTVTFAGTLLAVTTLEEDNAISGELAAYTTMMGNMLAFIAGGTMMNLSHAMLTLLEKGASWYVKSLGQFGFGIALWLFFSEAYHCYRRHCRLRDYRDHGRSKRLA